jgi:exodeoxyribonuclease V gamma subunit
MPGAASAPPGLSVLTSPRLEPLFDRLAAHVADDPLPPLERETVLVAQNKGLRVWLEQALARRLGCAASLNFRSPFDFATDLARQLVPRARPAEGESHPFDVGPLAWRLVPILDALPEDGPYAPLRAYLDRTGGAVMPLARRLAALFDEYQVYRPEVLAAWMRGENPHPDFAHAAWQADLWRRLHEGVDVLDRAEGVEALVGVLERPNLRLEQLLERLPTRLSVFGALMVAPAYYRVLVATSRHVPVTLYTVAPGPCEEGRPFAHPLLRALCERTRDYWSVLADLGAPPPEPLDVPVVATSALGQLQEALIEDRVPDAPKPLDPADRSIRVLDCHSEVRELEALRDALLDAFAEIDGLRPSDVLVVLPDLERYAPLVDAVFGAESIGPDLRIPYHVIDHPHAPARRVIEVFSKALRLHDGRVTASELLDLLHHPAVRRRAGVREDELPLLRAWVREAGVCWGLTAERKTRFDLPADDLHTWRFGLDRLLLGVATGAPREGGLVLGHLPCDAAGLGGADLLGRFAEWAEALFDALDRLDHARPLSAWPDQILYFLEGFLDPRDDEEVEAVVFLREKAAELELLHQMTATNPDLVATTEADDAVVSFRAVRTHFDGAAAQFDRHEPILTGRVTFAGPVTMCHAPYRVVAFVGLNDGTFPRPETLAGFDLIARDPRPGDRASRLTEKQIFLDAVLAARDRLVLSYVGRSQKDNAERAASVVLDAFLDAAERHWGPEARRRLVVQHRLQPFAEDYFRPDGPLHSYAVQHRVRRAEQGRDAQPFLDGDPLPLPDGDGPLEVTLHALVDAWTNPSRFVLRQRLRLSLDLDESALTDDEPVTLDSLQAFNVRQTVLEGLLDGLSEEDLRDRLLRGGLLPGGAPGAAWLRQASESVRPVAEQVRAWGATSPLVVATSLDGARVSGTVERVGARGALRFRAGKVREKDLVAAWVDHLALCAEGRTRSTCTLGTEKSCHFEPVDDEDARLLLQSLVFGYRRAAQQALPVYQKASYTYAEKLKDKHWEEFTRRIIERQRYGPAGNGPFNAATWAMKSARDAFDPFGDAVGDRGDAYVQLATRGRDPFEPEDRFARWSLCLWAPLLLYRRDGVPA